MRAKLICILIAGCTVGSVAWSGGAHPPQRPARQVEMQDQAQARAQVELGTSNGSSILAGEGRGAAK